MSEKNIRDVVAFLRSEEYPNTAQGLEESLDALLAEHRAALAASESRGYERAREQAQQIAATYIPRDMGYEEKQGATSAANDIWTNIRAMTDERATPGQVERDAMVREVLHLLDSERRHPDKDALDTLRRLLARE